MAWWQLAVALLGDEEVQEGLAELNPQWGKVKYDHYKLGAPWEDPITGVDYQTTSRRKKDWRGEWLYSGEQRLKSTGNYTGGQGGWDLDLGSGKYGAQAVLDLYDQIKRSVPERETALKNVKQSLEGGDEPLDIDSYASMKTWLDRAKTEGLDFQGTAQNIKDALLVDKAYRVPETELPTIAKFGQLAEALVPGATLKDATQFLMANENLNLLDTLEDRVGDFEKIRRNKLKDFHRGAKKSGLDTSSDIVNLLADQEFRSGFLDRDVQELRDQYASNIGLARKKFLEGRADDWGTNVLDVLSGFADEFQSTVNV